jgi:hypothetical protein
MSPYSLIVPMCIKSSHCGRIAHHISSINFHLFNHTPSNKIMTAFLRKIKASLLEHMKSMPDVHVAEEEDFVVCG